MGKGKILIALGLLLGIAAIVFWKISKTPADHFSFAPPVGSSKQDVENIFGKPFSTIVEPDKKALPIFFIVTNSFYPVYKDLIIVVKYHNDRVLSSRAFIGFGKPIFSHNDRMVDKLNDLKNEVKYKVKLQNALAEAAPMFLKPIKKLKAKQSSGFEPSVVLELPIIKNSRGSYAYWDDALFIDKNNKITNQGKVVNSKLYEYIEKKAQDGDLLNRIFFDKSLPLDLELIEKLRKKKINIYFAGYNPDTKLIQSRKLYSTLDLNTSAMKKLPVLNFKLNGYKYKFADEELSIINIERFFDRPEYQKGDFRLVVDVEKGSTIQEVFSFFNYIPKNFFAHLK